MNERIKSGAIDLAAHLALPPGSDSGPFPAVIVAHGYPSNVGEADSAAATFPELADRIATEMGWIALSLELRGCGESTGSFSLDGWLSDLIAATDHVIATQPVGEVWLVGFGTTGGLAICAGARSTRIRGVAALSAPADYDDWGGHPRRLLEHAREVGLIRDPNFPPSIDQWSRALRDIQPMRCVAQLAPRPLLLVHGSDDDLVPAIDARVLADAHGSAEIRIIDGAGHRLRHDPRAVAVLLGWLDRQHHSLRSA